MANEAVLIESANENPVQRTIADGSAGTDIEKGRTIMKLTDPNTVVASSGTGDEFGGILAAEKVGGDGSTKIGCHMNGVFDCTLAAGATCTIGEQLAISGANLLRAATEAEVQLGQWVGYADEAGSSSEVIRVRLRGG
jgi:hypothetical protein